MPDAAITCPRCGFTSHHPRDIAEGYCGQCHDWTSGAHSALAFREYLLTGEIPEWRKSVLIDKAVEDALYEAIHPDKE